MSTYHPDQWSSAAETYDEKVGRMDRSAVSRLIDRVEKQHPFTSSSYAVDLGSGTGSITIELSTRHPLLKIAAVDIAPGMLEILDRRVRSDELPVPKEKADIKTYVLDAAELANHFGHGFCSHIFSTFMVQYAHQPRDIVNAVYQSLQPGGSFGLGLWGRKNGPMIVWSEACAETDPNHKVVKSHELLIWTDLEELKGTLQEVGFRDVEAEIETLEFGCATTEDLVKFWFNGSNPVAMKFVKSWVDEGGDLEGVKRNYHTIAKKYGDHREDKIDVILATARKP